MIKAVKSIVTLSALGITGNKWDQVLWHGGAEEILAKNSDLTWQDLLSKRQISLKFPDFNSPLATAKGKAEKINYFLQSGGQVLGARGPHELGKLNRSSLPLLCAYLRGNRNLVRETPTVAIVGSRSPSPKGAKRAFQTANCLSKAGCLIVSGGANGIDLEAHKGALEAKAETLVILGDPVYERKDERPFRIRQLTPSSSVTTLTVFGPWVPTNRSLFVTRNQYIAAMADALIIIEGKVDSGTLHTARFARKIGTPVWVIPGEIDNPLAGAANLLLQEGEAKAFLSYEYFLKTLGIKKTIQLSLKAPIKAMAKPAISCETNSKMIDFFIQQKGRSTLDLLCEHFEKPVSELQKELLELELMDKVRKEGSEFVLLDI